MDSAGGSGTRAAKAAATRARMLDAAKTLFVQRGYARTTMQAIAAEAGVAVQTLYFTFTTKRAILKEVLDVEVAGDTAAVATLDRPWVARAMAAPPEQMLALLVAAAGEVLARVAPLLEVVRAAAATDPEIAQLWRTSIQQQHTVLMAFVGALAGKTGLRPGLNPAMAADIALVTAGPETYRLLVHERGWSTAAWRDWATDSLVRQLLPG